MLQGQGSFQREHGDLADAQRSLEDALAILSTMGLERSGLYLTTLSELGSLALDRGDLMMAEQLLSRAITGMRLTYGTSVHPQVAAATHELGRVQRAAGDLTRARKTLEELISLEIELYGTRDSLGTAQSEVSLATVLIDLDEQAEAAALAEHAARVLRHHLGAEHPWTQVADQLFRRGGRTPAPI